MRDFGVLLAGASSSSIVAWVRSPNVVASLPSPSTTELVTAGNVGVMRFVALRAGRRFVFERLHRQQERVGRECAYVREGVGRECAYATDG